MGWPKGSLNNKTKDKNAEAAKRADAVKKAAALRQLEGGAAVEAGGTTPPVNARPLLQIAYLHDGL